MKRLLLSISILLLLLSFAGTVKAQKHYRFSNNWSASFFVGTTNFHGDLSDNANSFKNNNPFSKYFYQDRRFGLGVYVDKMFNPYFGARAILMYATMKSTKESEKLYFTGNFFEYSISAVFNLSNAIMGIDNYRPYQVYGFIGIGFTETRSELYNLKNDSLVDRVGYHIENEGRGPKRLTELVMPVGLGINYSLNKQFSVFGEFTSHVVFSNKIDVYPVEGTAYESVGMINVGITYSFRLPSHWGGRGSQKYNGKSSDPAIRKFNKNKRVVMKTSANKRAMKYRYKKRKKKFQR